MVNNSPDHNNYGYQILITFLVALLGFGLFMVLAAVSATFIWDISLQDVQAQLNPNLEQLNLGMLKYFQIMQSLGLFIVSSLVIAWFFYGKESADFLFINKKPTGTFIITGILLVIVSLPFINLLGEINSWMNLPDFMHGIQETMEKMEADANRLTELFVAANSPKDLWINIFMIAVIPAFGEELLFRGILQRQLVHLTKNVHLGVFISAVLFSAMHMQFFGFMPRLALGILFGYLLVWSGSLWLPIIAHFTNNFLAVIAYTSFSDSQMEAMEQLGTVDYMIYAVFLSIILMGAMIYYMNLQKQSDPYALNTNFQ